MGQDKQFRMNACACENDVSKHNDVVKNVNRCWPYCYSFGWPFGSIVSCSSKIHLIPLNATYVIR